MRASSYRPGGMFRLMSMMTMLVVLGLIIARASDPATWAWLASDDQGVAQGAAPTAPEERAAPAEPAAAKPPVKPVTVQSNGTAQPKAETVIAGPTDEDIEEQDGASEEFMALTDGAIEMGREEMPAYWRLFGWTLHQSTAQLQKRAADEREKRQSKDVVFNQFIRDPDEQRGKLFRVELNVRRVLSYDAPENKAGVKKVYEIWGWTTESKAWLYCVLTPELPAGMPVGTDVYERASFSGYFLKVQGYHAAGAGPRDKPLAAPLLIGRIAWNPSALREARAETDWEWLARQAGQPGSLVFWVISALGVVAIAALGWWLYNFLTPRPAIKAAQSDFESTRKVADVRNWLADADSRDDFVPADESSRWNGSNGHEGKTPGFHNN